MQDQGPSLPQLIDAYQKCTLFASVCASRVQLLEEYKAESDQLIARANDEVYMYKERLEAEKKKRNIFIPALLAVAGFVLGVVVVR